MLFAINNFIKKRLRPDLLVDSERHILSVLLDNYRLKVVNSNLVPSCTVSGYNHTTAKRSKIVNSYIPQSHLTFSLGVISFEFQNKPGDNGQKLESSGSSSVKKS